MTEQIENLQATINKLRLELIAHITRALGKVYMIDASKISDGRTVDEILREWKSTPMQFSPIENRAVEEIDFTIDEEKCIEIIKEIKSAQNKIAEESKWILEGRLPEETSETQ